MITVNFFTDLQLVKPVAPGSTDDDTEIVNIHTMVYQTKLPLFPNVKSIKLGEPGCPAEDLQVYEIDNVSLNLSTREVDVELQGYSFEEKSDVEQEIKMLERMGFSLHSFVDYE